VEGDNAPVGRRFDDAELGGKLLFHGNGGDGDCGALLLVILDHAGDVHAVDMVAAEDGHHVRIGLFYQVDVLVDGVGRALVPGFTGRAHLGRHRNNELVLEEASELPALAEVLQQRLAFELGEHVDGVDARVDEIAEDEVDDAILPAEGDSGFGAFLGQRVQPGTLSTGQHDSQHA